MLKLTISLVTVYVILFGYFSMTHGNPFHPDFMNYVDVAKNIKEGRGIVQSTLGYNQKNFYEENDIPSQFLSQPLFYPVAIVLVSYLGFSPHIAAFILSTLCFGWLLLLGFALAKLLYGIREGVLTVLLLIFYLPLSVTVKYGLSEPLACVFLLLTLMIFIQSARRYAIVAGITAGMAFATRYAFLPLFLVGLCFFIKESRSFKEKLKGCFLFSLGFAIPAAMVFGHHFYVSGQLMSLPNPVTESFFSIFYHTLRAIFGEYFETFPIVLEARWMAVVLLLTTMVLCYFCRKSMKDIFWNHYRYLLWLWPLFYVVFLDWERSHFYFDAIDVRLVLPAGITLIVLWSALFEKAVNVRLFLLQNVLAFAALFLTIKVAYQIKKTPEYFPSDMVKQSEVMSWIDQNTNSVDLIIANDAVDIPFVFGDRGAISYSYYPDTEEIDEKMLQKFISTHSGKYKRIFFIFRTSFDQDKDYGTLINQLLKDPNSKFPQIRFVKKVQDGYIFELAS